MKFKDIEQEIYRLTKRPDLVEQTRGAIRLATLKAHHTDYYSKDLFEMGVDFEQEATRQQLDYISLVPNLRAFKYFRLSDSTCDDMGPFLEIITPEEILDAYGCNRTNIAYVAGRVLEIRSAADFRYGLLGCYVHPTVTDGDYCSWVAEQYPYCIIYETARVLFKTIGYDEESAQYNSLTAEAFNSLRLSNVQDVGY